MKRQSTDFPSYDMINSALSSRLFLNFRYKFYQQIEIIVEVFPVWKMNIWMPSILQDICLWRLRQ